MSSVDLSNYKDLYITTSKQQLQKIEEGIALLSGNSDSKEGFDAVYINSHSLVSKSLLMGYKQVGMLCGSMEKIFYKVKQGEYSISPELLHILANAAKALGVVFDSIKNDNKEIDLSTYVAKLQKVTRMELSTV